MSPKEKMMKIRKAKESDIHQLEKIFLVVRQQTFTWENPNKFKLEDYKSATDGETVFVAEEEDGKIVGFISVWERDAHPFIHHLFISADHQRKGIGTLLIKSLFAWLPRPYRLKCILKNQDAIAFYLKNHWLEIDRGMGEDGEYVLFELPVSRPFSKITLVPANTEDKTIIQNLGRFYVYEMSRFCGFLPTWETPSNGLFECIDLSSYCEKPDRHAFLIKVDDELAGFVLINKVGSTPDVDWNIGEFFIVSKFQGKGVGSYAAEQVFNQFSGVWESSQIPENTAAIKFWDRVVGRYSHGNFEKTLKIVPEPKPHPMVILKFVSQGSRNTQSTENMYKVVIDYAHSQADNEVIKEGLIKSYEAQFGERDKEFSIFLKSDSGKVFGGMQAMFDSEAIYIEALWIEENHRKQGYGKKLLAVAEREAIENGCRFSLVDTWDFQAEEFYLKNGYEKIGELKNYWHGHAKNISQKKHKTFPYRSVMRKYYKMIALVVFVLIVFTWAFAHPYNVPGDCMEPAIKDGSYVFVNLSSPYLRQYQIGDIIAFKHEGKEWVSRIVALETDTVQIMEGKVIVNGVAHQSDKIFRNWSNWNYGTYAVDKSFQVPLGHVFVLSDNLSAQHDDSRVFGPISENSIVGLVW